MIILTRRHCHFDHICRQSVIFVLASSTTQSYCLELIIQKTDILRQNKVSYSTLLRYFWYFKKQFWIYCREGLVFWVWFGLLRIDSLDERMFFGLLWLNLLLFVWLSLLWFFHRQTNKLNNFLILINLICEFVYWKSATDKWRNGRTEERTHILSCSMRN